MITYYKICIVCSKKIKIKKVTRVVDSISILCYNINTTGKEHIKNTTGNRIFKGIDNLKQDKNINIRVNGEMRAAFIKAAHDNDKNGTSLIRDFMQRYIDENQSTKS